jgi:hypothetical protein
MMRQKKKFTSSSRRGVRMKRRLMQGSFDLHQRFGEFIVCSTTGARIVETLSVKNKITNQGT